MFNHDKDNEKIRQWNISFSSQLPCVSTWHSGGERKLTFLQLNVFSQSYLINALFQLFPVAAIAHAHVFIVIAVHHGNHNKYSRQMLDIGLQKQVGIENFQE